MLKSILSSFFKFENSECTEVLITAVGDIQVDLQKFTEILVELYTEIFKNPTHSCQQVNLSLHNEHRLDSTWELHNG